MIRRRRTSRTAALLLAVGMLVTTACGGTGDSDGNAAQASDSSEAWQNGDMSAGEGSTPVDGYGQETADEPDITDTIPLNVIDDNYRTYYEVFVYSF